MDSAHFDQMVRSLAAPSRRALLAKLGRVVCGVLLPCVAAADARAKGNEVMRVGRNGRNAHDRVRSQRRKKRKKKRSPTGTVPVSPPPPACNPGCPGSLTCLNGACGCATGTRCGNDCVNLQTNGGHCGSCTHACGEICGETGVCAGGTCATDPGLSCPPVLESVTVSPNAVSVSSPSFGNGRVRLNRAPENNTAVEVFVDHPTVATVDSAVTVLAGQQESLFGVIGIEPSDSPVTLTARLNGIERQTQFTVVS